MKVLIDIPEDYLEDIRKERQTTLWRYAIANGKALSYMTNGEVFMTMFPHAIKGNYIGSSSDMKDFVIIYLGNHEMRVSCDWWNAPYKKEVEECAELIQAISKMKRGKDNRDNLIEEMADVYIILEQLKIIYGVTDDEIIKWLDAKQNRQRLLLSGGKADEIETD